MLVCAVQNFDKAGIRRRVLASSCYPAFFRGHQRVGTPEYLSMMRLRKIWAEGSFSVLKREHCISKIRKRGILAATEECLLAAMALNLKRMVNAIFRYFQIYCSAEPLWVSAEFLLLSTDPLLYIIAAAAAVLYSCRPLLQLYTVFQLCACHPLTSNMTVTERFATSRYYCLMPVHARSGLTLTLL